jgi:hypothetical protein
MPAQHFITYSSLLSAAQKCVKQALLKNGKCSNVILTSSLVFDLLEFLVILVISLENHA